MSGNPSGMVLLHKDDHNGLYRYSWGRATDAHLTGVQRQAARGRKNKGLFYMSVQTPAPAGQRGLGHEEQEEARK